MHRNSINVSTKQERIAELAKQSPQRAFTSLAYLIDIDWLKQAYRRTRKDGAVGVDGVDGVTAEESEQDLWDRLQNKGRSAHKHRKSNNLGQSSESNVAPQFESASLRMQEPDSDR